MVPPALRGKLAIMVRLCFDGDPAEGAREVAPIRALAEPLADMVGPMDYEQLFADAPPSHGETFATHTLFLDRFDGTVARTLLDHLSRGEAWLRMVQLRPMGGAIGRVPRDATAFAHRDRDLMMTVACNAVPDLGTAASWVEAVVADLPRTRPGAYVGFFGPGDADRIGEAYPPQVLQRLRRIKARYDPHNLFRGNDNITPAPA